MMPNNVTNIEPGRHANDLIIAYAAQLLAQAQLDQVQKLSVGAAVMHDGKLLILKRRPDDFMPNIYELPGGAIEGDESLLEAVERELVEETSCNIEKLLGYVGHIDFPSSKGLLTRRFNFLVEPQSPVKVELSEHDEYRWIEPSEAPDLNITPQTQGIIAAIRENKIHYF